MLKNKKLFGGLIIFSALFTLVPCIVNASAKTDEMIKKISPDGKTAVFKTVKPKDALDSQFLITSYVESIIGEKGYYTFAYCEAPYTKCTIDIQSEDLETSWDSEKQETVILKGEYGKYELNVTYDEPKQNINEINNIISKLKSSNMGDTKTMYQVDDLSLINYYMTSAKSELWNPGAPGRAIKYVSELNEITEGANVSYGMSVAAGQQDDSLMFEYAYGGLIVFYNGYAYGQKQEGVYLKRVLYIPQSTENTKEAYVAAAQKRINDYLGNNDVIVSYGGTISSLDSDAEDPQLPVITDDGNYYNIKIKGRTYKFYIIKGTSDKLKPPIYNAKNLDSNITVTSKDSSIPLDTTINVKLVENKNIKDKIGTDNYITYDINLYSNAKEASIEKITNDLFEVSIPVPERLNNKSLIVYYETNEGKLEEHEVTVKNGLAVFTTDHFSKYTLAEKTNAKAETLEKNPQTYDGIMKWVALGSISIFGIVGTVVYVKKHNI